MGQRLSEVLEYFKKTIEYEPKTGVFYRKVDIAKYKKGEIVGTNNGNGYLMTTHKNKKYYLHRLAWAFVYGKFPKDSIDHINGNRSDNRIKNLREAERWQNNQSKAIRKNNSSGFTGVSFIKSRGKWCARLNRKGKTVFHKGNCSTKEEAIKYYTEAKKKYHCFSPTLEKQHLHRCKY